MLIVFKFDKFVCFDSASICDFYEPDSGEIDIKPPLNC
jgi:hypothetical protein